MVQISKVRSFDMYNEILRINRNEPNELIHVTEERDK